MRALLLGGTGFLGSHLADALKSAGYSTVTASSSHRADIVVDLSKIAALRDLVHAAQAQVLINLAGTGLPGSRSVVNDQRMWQINSRLPSEVLRVLIETGNQLHFIHIASALEMVPEESTYALTKWQGSRNLLSCIRRHRDSGIRASIVALHNLYGPGQPRERFIVDTIHRAREGRQILIHHPQRTRDFVYVQDAVEALVSIIQTPPTGPTTQIVGTGVKTPVVEAAHMIVGLVGANPDLISLEKHLPLFAEPEPNGCFSGFERYLCKTSLEQGLLQTLRRS